MSMIQSLDGLSVGDAFGERFFGPPRSIEQRINERQLPTERPWKWTDDTAMAISLVEVLEAHGTVNREALALAFARRFRAEPDRGYGRGAYDILSDLDRGTPWQVAAQQVFDGQGSMGNGAAMRVAPLGAYFAGDLDRVIIEADRSAEVTHAHPDGRAGAIAVALAAAHVARGTRGWLSLVAEQTPAGATHDGLVCASQLPAAISPSEAARVLGTGQKVLSSDTVPWALWCAARWESNFVEAMWATVAGLGDRDTTCAIVGGVIAAKHEVPISWLSAREVLGRTA